MEDVLFASQVYGDLAEPLCRWFLAAVRRHGRRPSLLEVETQCSRLRSLSIWEEGGTGIAYCQRDNAPQPGSPGSLPPVKQDTAKAESQGTVDASGEAVASYAQWPQRAAGPLHRPASSATSGTTPTAALLPTSPHPTSAVALNRFLRSTGHISLATYNPMVRMLPPHCQKRLYTPLSTRPVATAGRLEGEGGTSVAAEQLPAGSSPDKLSRLRGLPDADCSAAWLQQAHQSSDLPSSLPQWSRDTGYTRGPGDGAQPAPSSGFASHKRLPHAGERQHPGHHSPNSVLEEALP